MNQLILLNLFNSLSGLLSKKQKLFLTTSLQFANRQKHFAKTSFDYIRLSSLEIISQEIEENKIEGNVAELGVHKGGFAQHISACFPNRRFYLFDTFEGFHEQDIKAEINKNFSAADQDFSDTSVEKVLSVIPHPQQCIVRKGHFPETATGLEDQFCFVSLDTDLYEPIYQGLRYFYPRLTKGGFIFVHDYNNVFYSGAKAAVRKYCKETGIGFVPIADSAGTAVIVK